MRLSQTLNISQYIGIPLLAATSLAVSMMLMAIQPSDAQANAKPAQTIERAA